MSSSEGDQRNMLVGSSKTEPPKVDFDYWTTVANKLAVEEDTTTEKTLFEDSLAALRTHTVKLDETRWFFEDMPTNPEKLEASVGL